MSKTPKVMVDEELTPRTWHETYLEPSDTSLIGIPVVRALFAAELEMELSAAESKVDALMRERDERFENHTKAVAEWVSELAETLGLMGEGPFKPENLLEHARQGREWAADMQAKVTGLMREKEELLNALEEISHGTGAFAQDRLEHATNCIESMKDIAIRALVREQQNTTQEQPDVN